MYSKTVDHLEKFDNQHDFERMSADILNALGYKDVVLIAPRGGSDGGRDITFTTENGGKGLACVTLRKDSDKKFDEDFSQRNKGDFDKYFFFTNQYLTADQKKKYAHFCLDQLDAELVPQDIEAIRSLLDNPLKAMRDAYLSLRDDKQSERQIAKSVLNFLEDRRVLYNPFEFEELYECVYSVIEIRRFLTEKMDNLDQSSELSQSLRMMRAACRKFLDATQGDDFRHFSRGSYKSMMFFNYLGEMRGVFGMCLSKLLLLCKLDIEESLATILPANDEDEKV